MFEIIVMAAAGNLTAGTPTVSESISSLVNAVSLLVGAVVPLIIAVFSYVKAKSHDPKIDQAMNTGIAVGRIATATANKALENKKNIKAILDIGISMAPQDAQKAIAERQALIEKLNKEIQATSAQISRLKPNVPGDADADSIMNLPREKDFSGK